MEHDSSKARFSTFILIILRQVFALVQVDLARYLSIFECLDLLLHELLVLFNSWFNHSLGDSVVGLSDSDVDFWLHELDEALHAKY